MGCGGRDALRVEIRCMECGEYGPGGFADVDRPWPPVGESYAGVKCDLCGPAGRMRIESVTRGCTVCGDGFCSRKVGL